MKPNIRRVQVGKEWVWHCKSENIEAWCDSPARVFQAWRKAVKDQIWLNNLAPRAYKTVTDYEVALAYGVRR